MESKKSLTSILKNKAGGIALSTFALNAIYAVYRGFSDGTNPQPLPIIESTIFAGLNTASVGLAGSAQRDSSPKKTRSWAIGGAIGSEASFWVVYFASYWGSYLINKI